MHKTLLILFLLTCAVFAGGTPVVRINGPALFTPSNAGKPLWPLCKWKNGETSKMLLSLASPTGEAKDAGILSDGKRYNQIGKVSFDGSAVSVMMTFKLTPDYDKKRRAVLFCYCTDKSDSCRLRVAITHKGELEVDYKIKGATAGDNRGFTEASVPLEWNSGVPYAILFTADNRGNLAVYRNGEAVISLDNAPMSIADLIPRRLQTNISLLTIGFDPIYDRTFFTPLRAIISQFELYESIEKPQAAPAAAAASSQQPGVRHLVINGQWSRPFDIREKNGELLGTFVRVDEKFYENAARVRLTAAKEHLLVEMSCPIPSGMATKNTPGNFWREDRIEFFIRPDLSSPVYYQYAATPDGQSYVGCGMKELKNHASTFKVATSPSGYTVAVTIPYSELGISSLEPGRRMSGNFHRCGPTAGGTSSFVLATESFHSPDDFVPIFAQSAKPYFMKRLQDQKNELAKTKTDSDIQKEISALEKMLESDGDSLERFQAIEEAFASLDNSMLSLSLNGRQQMVWQPDVWSNRMHISKLARPIQNLHVRMPRNSKKYIGIAFTNLKTATYTGQVKIAPEWPLSTKTKVFDNMAKWPPEMKNIRIYEAIATDDLGGKPCYDALSPLPMGTVLRVHGKETLPLWLEFSSKNLPAGVHHWKIVFKASQRPVEVIDLTWEIIDIDLNDEPLDATNYSFMYKRCWHLQKNLRKMWVEQGYNILYIEPGYANMKIYGSTKADGTYVPGNMAPLESAVALAIESGLDPQRFKIMFSLNWLFNFGGNPSSKGWAQNMTNNLQQWSQFLQKRFNMSPERIIFYCADEPNGDIHDPKTSMHKAWQWGKLIRKAVPQCRQMVNPFAWKIDDNLRESYRLMAEDYDIFEPYRPTLNDAKFLAFVKSLNREIWTYDILNKSSSPDDYRHNYWRNGRDGLSGITCFWSLDDMAGGDGFDPLDVSDPKGRQIRTDYGMAYVDFNLGTYLPGRRLIAANMGWHELRLARLCQRMTDRLPDAVRAPYAARLKAILAEGSDGDGRVMDALSDKLLTLTAEVKGAK